MENEEDAAKKKAQLDVHRQHLEVGKNLNPRSAHATAKPERIEEIVNLVWKKYPDVLSGMFDDEINSIAKSHPHFFSTLEPVKRQLPPPAIWDRMSAKERLDWGNGNGKIPAHLTPKTLSEEQKAFETLPPKQRLEEANRKLHEAFLKREADKRAKKL